MTDFDYEDDDKRREYIMNRLEEAQQGLMQRLKIDAGAAALLAGIIFVNDTLIDIAESLAVGLGKTDDGDDEESERWKR